MLHYILLLIFYWTFTTWFK